MAKLLTPLNQAALKAEDFSKIERENKEISVSYDRGFFHHVKKGPGRKQDRGGLPGDPLRDHHWGAHGSSFFR